MITNWYKTSMTNRHVPKISDPESQLEFLFNCTSISQSDRIRLEILECMDNNNDWTPTLKTRRFFENFVGAVKDDYALRFKYCVQNGDIYVGPYFSGIHYVFKVL